MLFYIRKILSYISLFFVKGALSDRDIKKLLGQHIFIYPFKNGNLKASSYNLTASKCAFVKEEEMQRLIVQDDKIVIPAGKTAIIETQESIYVSKWITGTYHSRVKLANMGLGHIGTTLDPCFWGISAIALHNTNQKDITIKVGDPIVTIMFYVLKSRSTGLHDNMSGRVDDNIQLGIDNFYDFKDAKKTINTVLIDKIKENETVDDEFIKQKIKVIRKNEDKNIKNKSIIIYDIDDPICENCKNCNEKEKCAYKLLKNINEEKEKRERIIEELKTMKSQPWITSKEGLIKKVQFEVKKNNIDKDTLIYNLMALIIGIGFIIAICIFISGNPESPLNKTFQLLITPIIPTVAIIIGVLTNNKNRYKGE